MPFRLYDYLPILLMFVVAAGFAVGNVLLSQFVGQRKRTRTKLMPYECGKDPVGSARERFSVKFYLIAMIFILFDIEVIFLVPWAAYGAVAFLVVSGVGSLVESSPEAARWLGVGIIAVAGLYQFTPMKRRALDHCRMALHASGVGSLAGDLRAGADDGAVCVGCCWALMATLISAGVMNLTAMVGLAAVIFGEKVLPRPRLVAGIAGAALLLLAVAAAIDPSLLSGVVMDEMRMSE